MTVSGSVPCSRGSEVSTSDSKEQEDSRSDGNAKSIPTANGSSQNIGRGSQYIQTLLNLKEQSSNPLICSAEDSPARTYRPQENGPEWERKRDRDYGPSTLDLLGRLNPDGSLSRMSLGFCQSTLEGEWERYSTTWPFAGIMRNGIASARPASGRSTDATESLLWRTPDTSAGGTVSQEVLEEMAAGKWITDNGRLRQLRLQDQVRHRGLYPTPTAKSYGSNQSPSPGATVRPSLETMARKNYWRTPMACDYKNMTYASQEYLSNQVRFWPTPRAGNPGSRPNGKGGKILAEEVKKSLILPTPTTRDWKDSGPNTDYSPREGHSPGLPQVIGGQLNPTWVEWLMGFPLGWTDLEPSEMRSSPRSRNISDGLFSNTNGVI